MHLFLSCIKQSTQQVKKPFSHYINPFLILISIYPLVMTNCIFTTQSYNHGKLLNPGDAMATIGAGGYFRNKDEDLHYYQGPYEIPDSSIKHWWSFCIGYRLGIHDKAPFGNGIEIGFQIEGGMRINTYYDAWFDEHGNYHIFDSTRSPELDMPPSLEFDVRMGFNSITLNKSIYHHNCSLGWIVGYWVDNGWFAGYAGGWEFKKVMPYVNARLLLTATDAIESDISVGSDNFFTTHDQQLSVRLSGGIAWRLKKMVILPDYISPEVSFIFPDFSHKSEIGFTYHIGFRWTNGL